MSSTVTEILFILLLILLNGIFSMSEIALASSRRARLQHLAEEGDKSAKTALELISSPNRLFSTVQIGISLIGIVTGALGGATLTNDLAALLATVPFLAPASNAIALILVIFLITYFSLVLGELIPKRLGLHNPEKVALAISRPMKALSWLFHPIVSFLSASTDFGLKLIGQSKSQAVSVTEEEIKILIEQGRQVGVFEEAEQTMVEGIFRLGDRSVDALMTPRTEVLWIDLEEPFEENLKIILASQYSRLPAAQGTIDEIIGILIVRDLITHLVMGEKITDLRPLLKPPLFVPESMPALNVLELFKKSSTHLAVVIDEYGSTLGIVTLFDILESIVGELPGQGPDDQPQVVTRPDGSLLIDGMYQVDELKDLLEVSDLPDEDKVGYQTLAGFVLAQFGNIPSAGEFFEWENYRFEVMDMDGLRIDKVLISRITPPEMEKHSPQREVR
jgi:putative hemolysin